jgi:hypothetical protein
MWTGVPTLLVTAAIALAVPAVAHADAHDDDFVNDLAGQGITGDPAKLVSTAHMVCTTSTEASSASSAVPAGLGRMMPMGYVLTSLRLNMRQIPQFMDAARAAYCPPPAAGPPPDAPPPGALPPGAPPSAVPAPAMAGMPGLAGLSGVSGIPGMDRLSSALGGG